MNYVKENYVGKKVILWPNDTRPKYATIINVDDLGFTFRINKEVKTEYNENDILFVSHSYNSLFFKILY